MSHMDTVQIITALEAIVFAFIQSAAASDTITIAHLRMVYVASVSHSLLRTGRTMTKRDLYYLCRELFKSAPCAERSLARLSRSLNVPANDLSIVAAPKGLVSGPLSYIGEHNEQVNVAGFGPDGALIPNRPERLRALTTSAHLVLVLEKETAFESLVLDPDFQRTCDTWLVVTGKGYPDHATRNLLKRLIDSRRQQNNPLPVCIVTDADPHGIGIAVCYARALHSTDVRWVGVHPSHRDRLFTIPVLAELPLTQRERQMASNLLAEGKANMAQFGAFCQDICRELAILLGTGIKFEIEAIATSAQTAASNPLFDYVITVVSRIMC